MIKKSPLGRRLATARELGGLTGRQLSELAMVSDGLVSQVERGSVGSPKATVLGRIALVLGASLDWLVLGTGEAPTKEAVLAAVERARTAAAAKPRRRAPAKAAA